MVRDTTDLLGRPGLRRWQNLRRHTSRNAERRARPDHPEVRGLPHHPIIIDVTAGEQGLLLAGIRHHTGALRPPPRPLRSGGLMPPDDRGARGLLLGGVLDLGHRDRERGGSAPTVAEQRKAALVEKEEGGACWAAIWGFRRFGESNGYSAAEPCLIRHPTHHVVAPLLRLARGSRGRSALCAPSRWIQD